MKKLYNISNGTIHLELSVDVLYYNNKKGN